MTHEIPIAYGIFTFLIFLVAGYFVIGYFEHWPPYRKTDNSQTTINTKNKSFNNSIFYVSITVLIITFLLLLAIVIVATTIKHKQRMVLRKIDSNVHTIIPPNNTIRTNNLNNSVPTRRVDEELTQREILLQKELQETRLQNELLQKEIIQEKLNQQQIEGVNFK